MLQNMDFFFKWKSIDIIKYMSKYCVLCKVFERLPHLILTSETNYHPYFKGEKIESLPCKQHTCRVSDRLNCRAALPGCRTEHSVHRLHPWQSLE